MQDPTYHYTVERQPDANWLRRLLAPESYNLAPQTVQTCRRIYFDTFDWRLHRKGLILSLDQTGSTGQLYLYDRQARSEPPFTLSVFRMPAFPAELPTSRLRTRLMKFCSMRALLPVVNCRHVRQACDVRDSEGKTLARIWRSSFHENYGSNGKPFLEQVMVEPLRGYTEAAEQVRQVLAPRLLLTEEQAEPFGELCRRHAIQPGAYNSKLRVPLTADWRADEALGRLLTFLLNIMEVNETGIRDDIDTEFLHDFRIACRRSRTLLNQTAGVFPQDEHQQFRQFFAWLSRATSVPRDLDVFLLELDDLIDQAGINPARGVRDDIRGVLQRERGTARKELLAVLQSRRYDYMKRDWRGLLERAAGGGACGELSAQPVQQLANQRIWRQARKMLNSGASIDPYVDTVALHELRKRGKKLRYLLEAFYTLYPAREITQLIKNLKKLQDTLGSIVDASVQSETLQHIRNDKSDELVQDGSLETIQQLIDDCDQRHECLLGHFHKTFAVFAGKNNRKLMKQLFRKNKGKPSA